MSLRVGVVGYGYWGPNLVRNFAAGKNSTVVAVSDLDPKRLELVGRRYPAVETTTEVDKLLQNPEIDAVAIATPVATHYDLALRALRAGKHVFVEKPLTDNAAHAEELVEEAARRNLVLQVDHTFIYTAAVRKIHDLVSSGELGEIYYYDSVRVNLGLFQSDVSVIWDLAVHDLSIIERVFPERPVAVSATGQSHVATRPANIAFLTLFFPNNMIAHIHVNWLAPVKIRQTLVGGSRKMVVYNDLEASEKIKIYDKGIHVNEGKEEIYKTLIGYRTGDMVAPNLEVVEALQVEVDEFVRAIDTGTKPLSDGESGLAVVRVLEAASQSMSDNGRPVTL